LGGRRAAARVLAAVALSVAAASPARAWDKQGHMATGAIAYDTLMRENPRVVAQIVALMAHHPDRARFERELAGVAPGSARDRLLFEYMARWPDDVGGTPADHEPWHYQVKMVAPLGAVLPLVFGKAEEALDKEAAVAADPRAAAADRAVALCWIFHIVGDMQQPLHAGYWVNWRFWKSDHAGTWAYVRRAAGAAPLNLHDYWDESVNLPMPEVAGAAALARRAEQDHPRDARAVGPAGPPRTAFAVWAAEDHALARDVAYNHGDFRAATKPADAPVVAPAYAAQVRRVAQARIALGGYRLAALLRGELEPRSAHGDRGA